MDLAQLGIRINTSEVKAGGAELDKLTGSAQRAEAAVDKLGPAAAGAADSVKKLGAGTRTVGPALATQAQSFQLAGISARQYSAALRTVPAQITDIVTGLAGGQNPFLVAIQQGGQLRDQFGGFGNALRALGTILTPARLAIGALAGVVATAAKGFADGQRESFEFARVIALSGNAAGVTAGQLGEDARKIDSFAGTTANAADVLARLAGTGKVAGDDLATFAAAAIKLERAGGQSVEQTIKQFEALGKKPRQAVLELSGSFGFLTERTFEQVLALEKQGKTLEAGRVSQQAFAEGLETISQKLEKQRGTLQNFGRGSADAFKELGDSLLDLGRVKTLENDLEALQARLKRAQNTPVTAELVGDADIAAIKKLIDAKQEQIDAERAIARAEAERLAKTASGLAKLNAAFEGEKEQRQQLLALAKAQVNADISGLRRTLDARLDAFAGSEAELDALRSAGLVSDQEFFDRRRQIIEESTAAQVDSLRQQAARLAEENASGIDKLMNLERIRDLQAEINRLLADGATRQKVLSIEQEGATRKLTASLDDAKRSAAEFLETLDRTFSRELELQGAGNKARQRQGEVDRIKDQFDSQRRQLDREQRRNPGRAAELDQERQIIDETELQALERLGEQFDKLDERSASFVTGAREAFANYLDDLKNVSAQSEQLFTKAFRGAEDALVEFATTGKLSFKDLANSILQDLVRIQIRALIVRAIAGSGALSGLFGGGAAAAGGSIGARASGGPVDSGQPYLVGEQGPELFVPRSNGNIIPSKQTMQLMSSGQQRGGPVINIVNNNSFAAGIDQTRIEPMLRASEARTRQAIADDLRRGRLDGALSGAQR